LRIALNNLLFLIVALSSSFFSFLIFFTFLSSSYGSYFFTYFL